MTVSDLKEYIYSNDKIPFVLESLKCHHIKIHSSGGYYTCANPDGDNLSAVLVYNDKHLSVVNYTRDLKKIDVFPDVITLIKFYKKYDFRQAVKWLHEIFGLEFKFNMEKADNTNDPMKIFKSLNKYKKNSIEYKILNENLLTDFYPYVHKDFAAEGILKDTVKKFQLGYSYEARGTIIPIRYWLDGSLIGIVRRTSVPNYKELNIPKYFPIKPYLKSGNVYGLWENYEEIQKARYCIVYEAQKSVLKRDTLNDHTGVAVCGHDISEEQVCILCGLNLKEIIIAFDKDVDINVVRGQCEKFYGIRNVSYMYDFNNDLEDKEAPADSYATIFDYMFNNRVTYDEVEHLKYQEYLNELSSKRVGT